MLCHERALAIHTPVTCVCARGICVLTYTVPAVAWLVDADGCLVGKGMLLLHFVDVDRVIAKRFGKFWHHIHSSSKGNM